MTNIDTRHSSSILANHEVRVAVCFWLLVAGLALVVANALAAAN